MKIIKLNCTACGAPISIPEQISQLTCSNCGSQLHVERGEGYYALEVAAKITEAIRQSSDASVKEMRRSQIIQSMNHAEDKLAKSRQEQAEFAGKPRSQFSDSIYEQLVFQEWCHAEEYRHLQGELDTLEGPILEKNALALQTQIDFIDHSIVILKTLPKGSMYSDLMDNMIEERNLYEEFLGEKNQG